ncbi:MAG: exodeoxyribonuclease V subunit alpha [Polyangiaceae bacterium]
MKALTPAGTATERFLREHAREDPSVGAFVATGDDFEPAYIGWEVARCAVGLAPTERRALGALVAACVASIRAGSTRLALEGGALAAALSAVGAPDALDLAQALARRARSATSEDPVRAVMGRRGDRRPLIVDGAWLYAERMLLLEERFCARIRDRLAGLRTALDTRAPSRAIAAVAAQIPLTDEQKRAVREILRSPLALITGGPGTGKTSTVVAAVRAMAWLGTPPFEAIAIAAPTGKAAQRLADAIAQGLARAPADMAESSLRMVFPPATTLHRLLGWSPSKGRFARHENDPLPQRLVIVDEASMIDLAMMDRLLRALRPEARLVLVGDADQLPSVEAGAVFRDLCAALDTVRLTRNLRVLTDTNARRIIDVAHAINDGTLDARFAGAVTRRSSIDEASFEGVEHVDVPWAVCGEAVLERWWHARVADAEWFAERTRRAYRMRNGVFDAADEEDLRALFRHHARARILAAIRVGGSASSADAINARLLERLGGGFAPSRWRSGAAGAPVIVQRNDYVRGLFNGEQGVVVHVESDARRIQRMAVFARGEGFEALPVDAIPDLAPAFAMTVHKAQGSEFDDILLVLPDEDVPLLTRELVYTAVTRARRSVVLVGSRELLARAVSRTTARSSGIAERLRSER